MDNDMEMTFVIEPEPKQTQVRLYPLVFVFCRPNLLDFAQQHGVQPATTALNGTNTDPANSDIQSRQKK